jgi:hypothetical protein
LKCLNITKKKLKINLTKKIKIIKSDKGGEYEEPSGELCFKNGIIH